VIAHPSSEKRDLTRQEKKLVFDWFVHMQGGGG